jgi:2-C-methyl-D-erythritol 4-phosphate cytidylyltransferase
VPEARKVIAVVPAAGLGTRLGPGANKTFLPLLDRPLIAWTLLALQAAEEIAEIIPVLKESDMEQAAEMVERYGLRKVKRIAPGGAERQDSVLSGLKLIKDPYSTVLIHDGARPLVEHSLIRETIAALEGYDGAVAALPARETIKEAERGGLIRKTLDRHVLWSAQTPQVFPYRGIMEAYEEAARDGFYSTDDSALVERRGGRVRVVMGSPRNIKITTPEDLGVAELFLRVQTRKG